MPTTLAILPAFIAPALAWAGLAAVSIPIAIHILSRRPRKPVPWAAMRFVLAAYRRHRVRTRFEQFLLLAVRCLLMLLIGLALAGPLWSAAGLGGTGGRTLVMVLDNSLTAEARDAAGSPRFQQLRTTAEKLLNALQAGDRVALVTASRPAQALVWPPTSDPQAVLHQIQTLPVTPASADIPGALKLVTRQLDQLQDTAKRPTYVALLSDFSAGSVPLDQPLPQELARLGELATLLAVEPAPAVPNIQIAALEPDRRMILAEPGGAASVNWVLKLRRLGPLPPGPAVTPVRLAAPGVAPRRIDVRWQPGQSQSPEISVNMPLGDNAAATGLLDVEAALEPAAADALDADNTRRALVRVRQKLAVLMVGRHDTDADRFTPRLWLTTALAPVADRLGWPLEIRELDAATLESDPDGLPKADVVLVLRPDLLSEAGWSALRQWTEGGGLAWFLTPPQRSATLWPTQLAASMGLRWSIGSEPVKHDPPLSLATDAAPPAELSRLRSDLADLLRPVQIIQHLPIDPGSLGSATDVMLRGSGGQPLLIGAGSPRGRGRVLLLATALDDRWTNLPTKPLFVPLLHELLRATLDRLQNPNSYEPGDRPTLLGPSWAHATKLTAPDNTDLLLIPEGTEGPRDQGTKGGADASSPSAPGPLGPSAPGSLGPSSAVVPIRPLSKVGLYRSATDALVVNVDPAAADTAATPSNSLHSWLAVAGAWKPIATADPAAALHRADDQPDLSWPLLWGVLGLAILETLLARRFSHASTTHRTADATQAAPAKAAA